MRNYTHFKGGLSKIEFDEDTGEFVSKILPVLPEPEPPVSSGGVEDNSSERPVEPDQTIHAIAAE